MKNDNGTLGSSDENLVPVQKKKWEAGPGVIVLANHDITGGGPRVSQEATGQRIKYYSPPASRTVTVPATPNDFSQAHS